jgi:hypothetical protein
MTTQDMPLPEESPVRMRRRVVETEIRLPRMEDLNLPKVDLKPVRDMAGEVLITSLGIGVLMVRGVLAVVRAANEAGKKELDNPGPVTKPMLNLVRREGKPADRQVRMAVPMLPLDNYDELSVAEIFARLPDLSEDQIRVLRDYENTHQARVEVLDDINRRLPVT